MATLPKNYRRDCLLGALSALLMLVGDLCLSLIPASPGDSGLFLREAYLNGSYPTWRLPLLLGTGLMGMALGVFTVRVSIQQILPQYRKTRRAAGIGGAVYLASTGVLHFWIGSLADWTSRLSPLMGREGTVRLIQSQYARLMPAMSFSYAGMILMMLTGVWAVLTRKTLLPRWMALFHLVLWQILFALIPDLRQALGAEVSTWDFVLSQCSGNAGLLIWMLANASWARRQDASA